MKTIFTHLLVKDFGWEVTILNPTDFISFEKLGYNEIDGNVYIAFHDNNKSRILKGYDDTTRNRR